MRCFLHFDGCDTSFFFDRLSANTRKIFIFDNVLWRFEETLIYPYVKVIKWCVSTFGPECGRWRAFQQNGYVRHVLFQDEADAMMFYLYWNDYKRGQ